jgi:hypothetical protein
MYNYYMKLVKINRDRILYSAFTTDQDLAQENSKCWFSTLNKIFKILKLDIKYLADNSVFRNNLIEYYHQQSDSQLFCLYFSTEFTESFFSWNFRFIISTPLYI